MERNKEKFFEAFAHTSHRVMGRKLNKFTLYHRFWLEAMESPLVLGGAVSILDIELASRVCGCRYGEVERAIAGGAGGWKSWKGWWFALRCLVLNADVEARNWEEYLKDHICGPNTHSAAQTTKDGVAYEDFPGIMEQVCAVIRGTGWEPETVWNLGPGEAEWYMCGVYRLRGVDMRVKSEHDEEFEAAMAADKAEEERREAEAIASEDG
jgi:hypothetical protein